MLKLRRALGDDAVAFEPPGYRLGIDGDGIDAGRFERLVERARGFPQNEPDAAEELLGEALGLWRGPALADVAYQDWAAGEAARLDELRLQAEELKASAILRAGRQGEAIGVLESLVRAEPLRERLWALLIIALYRDGRQADSLSTYATARRHLVEELGVEPSADLQGIHDRVLRQDPSLAGSNGAADLGAATSPRPGTRLPGALARYATAEGFVGREPELEFLETAWLRASGGEATSVFVSGEPGAGKTHLAAEHARTLADRGARVIYGRAVEDVEAPYGPLVSALGQLVETSDPNVLEQHVETHGGELARLVPVLATRVPDLPPTSPADPDTERLRLRAAVTALVAAVSVREPVVLVLDDIQWADRATLGLLLHLMRGSEARLLVVATYRDTPTDQGPPLRESLGDLLAEPQSRHLALSALRTEDVIGLLGDALGHSPDDAEAAFGRALHKQTEGNALFTTELIRHLADSGRLGEARGDIEAAGIPPTVRELVLQRLERTGDAAAGALLPATVIGLSFDAQLLSEVAGIRPPSSPTGSTRPGQRR